MIDLILALFTLMGAFLMLVFFLLVRLGIWILLLGAIIYLTTLFF